MFDKYFGHIRTANFAVAGDTTQGVLWGLRNGEGQGFQPKAVMLMIGTNNSGTFTAPEIAEGVGAVVLELRRNFPDAKILLLAIFPRGVPGDPVRDKIAEVNRIVARLDDQRHVFYHGHRREVPRRQGSLPPRFVPTRQSAPAGEGLRHLGRGGQRQAGGADEVVHRDDRCHGISRSVIDVLSAHDYSPRRVNIIAAR